MDEPTAVNATAPTVGEHLDQLVAEAQAKFDSVEGEAKAAREHLDALIALKTGMPSHFLGWLKAEFHKLFG